MAVLFLTLPAGTPVGVSTRRLLGGSSSRDNPCDGCTPCIPDSLKGQSEKNQLVATGLQQTLDKAIDQAGPCSNLACDEAIQHLRKTVAKVIQDSADQSAQMLQVQGLMKDDQGLGCDPKAEDELASKIDTLEKALVAAEAMIRGVVDEVLNNNKKDIEQATDEAEKRKKKTDEDSLK